MNIRPLKMLCLLVLLLQAPALFAQTLVLDETYQQFQGKSISLKQQLGHKPIYLKLWATWCLDCRKQMPDLQAVYTKYKDAINIYAVNLNINETQETLQAIKDKYQLTVPMVLDNNGTIASNFNFVGTPFHVLINAEGKVVYTSYHADADLHLKLDQLAHATLVSAAKVEGVKEGNNKRAAPDLPVGFAVRYFSASWCGWYFADIEPAMAQNCVRGDALASALFKQSSSAKINWASYATYLWAEPKDVGEYKKKQALPYAIIYDSANTFAQSYKVSQYPTLIVFKNGKEIRRLTQFDEPETLQKTLASLLQLK